MNLYSLEERKLVYRVLHKNLVTTPALIDSAFLADLQTDLQRIAQTENVDISDHGQWDAWLGNETASCAVRIANRKLIG
jgi:hypothetical protein